MVVEPVICRLKVFRILAGPYRNRRRRLGLRVNLIAAIYNRDGAGRSGFLLAAYLHVKLVIAIYAGSLVYGQGAGEAPFSSFSLPSPALAATIEA